MTSNKSGFTIIEIIITVSVIAILAAMTVVVYTGVQANARDTERSSKITAIADALEKYYLTNGEYPGCSAMTQSGSQVSTSVLKGIDPDILVAPKAAVSVTNSITCAALTPGGGTDAYAYVGDGSATCSTGSACTQYTLQYRQESTGNIISLASRH